MDILDKQDRVRFSLWYATKSAWREVKDVAEDAMSGSDVEKKTADSVFFNAAAWPVVKRSSDQAVLDRQLFQFMKRVLPPARCRPAKSPTAIYLPVPFVIKAYLQVFYKILDLFVRLILAHTITFL